MYFNSHRLDKTYKKELESRLNVNDDRYDIQNFRWASILKQKQFQLLGRFINIGKLVSQFCNQHFRTSLDISISRYEATDITYIVVR
jgi:hypothetical protein